VAAVSAVGVGRAWLVAGGHGRRASERVADGTRRDSTRRRRRHRAASASDRDGDFLRDQVSLDETRAPPFGEAAGSGKSPPRYAREPAASVRCFGSESTITSTTIPPRARGDGASGRAPTRRHSRPLTCSTRHSATPSTNLRHLRTSALPTADDGAAGNDPSRGLPAEDAAPLRERAAAVADSARALASSVAGLLSAPADLARESSRWRFEATARQLRRTADEARGRGTERVLPPPVAPRRPRPPAQPPPPPLPPDLSPLYSLLLRRTPTTPRRRRPSFGTWSGAGPAPSSPASQTGVLPRRAPA